MIIVIIQSRRLSYFNPRKALTNEKTRFTVYHHNNNGVFI